MPMIVIENLTKQFGEKKAVNSLNLSIEEGEIFGFLGPNGAGKTTTIKILTGLLKPSSGKVTIGGFDILTAPQAAKYITGYVPEDPFVYDKLTGREFLQLVGGLYSLKDKEIEAQIDYWTEFFQLESYMDTLTESYSHGTKQKIVMSAALMHNPKLMIIDEPMVGLDPISTRKVKDLIKSKAQEGTTIFLSTHILSVAEELCDRVGIIHQGVLIATGSLSEVKQLSKTEDKVSLETVFLKLTENGNNE